MKKSLSLLVLSLLLVAAMMLGVSANVTDSDVGLYVRFDSQEAIDTYTAHGNIRLSFDAEKGALMMSVPVQETATLDANAWFNFDTINIADYPYFRMTFMVPTTGVNGLPVATNGGHYVHFFTNVAPAARDFGVSARDTKIQWIKNISDCGATINQIRTDFPNNAQIGSYYEYYIYDIGFFKTEAAAKAYNPGLEYYYIDMTDPEEGARWTASQSTMTYDAEMDATVFTHAAVAAGEKCDARVSGRKVDPMNYFPLEQYPVYSWKYKTNLTSNAIYLLDTSYAYDETGVLKEGGLGSGLAYNNVPFTAPVADQWNIGYADLSAKAAGLEFVGTHAMDPYNAGAPTTGEEWIAWKYIAYFKTADQAAKGVTYEPAGLEVVPATSADGKAAITGVDSTMEYTTDKKGTGYTAVVGDTIEAAPGTTYYVRYAATEEANASNPTEVTVPNFWDFEITKVMNSKGETVDADIVKNAKDDWTITVPFGTNLKALTFSWNLTSSLTGARNAATLFINGDKETRTAIAPTEYYDLSAFTAEGGADVVLYYQKALNERINIELEVVGADMTDAELAEMIIDALNSNEIDPYIFLGIADADSAYDALYAAAEIAVYTESFAGSEIGVEVTAFEAATKGDAEDLDGTDGNVSFKYVVTYGDATVESDVITLAVPAQHFRVLWKFNDQEFADKWSYNATAVDKTANGKIPVIYEDGESFARVNLTGSNGGGIYMYYNTGARSELIYAGEEYDAFFNSADYPYTAVYYRSSGILPDTDTAAANTGATHIYFHSSEYAKNNHYDYAPVPEGMEKNPDIDAFVKAPAGTYPGGSYMGYAWARNQGFWYTSDVLFPKDTNDEWYAAKINNLGDTAGLGKSGTGYSVSGYKTAGVKFPWVGDIYEWRLDVLKDSSVTSGTMDILAVAFFSNEEDMNAFDLSTIDTLTAEEKAAVDAVALADADGLTIVNEAAALAEATAQIEAALADNGFAAVKVDKVSYTAMNAANNTDGALTVNVTVVKGDTLGDRDVYTVEKVLNIIAPEYTVDAAAAAVDNVVFEAQKGLSDEAEAKAYAMEALADVIAVYSGYTFEIVDATFVAPVEGVSDGSYTFKVEVSYNEASATSEEYSFDIIKGVAPYVINFDNEVIATNALLNIGHFNNGSLSTSFIDSETSVGGKALLIERHAETPEFSVTFEPGFNGMEDIEDLSEYTVVGYRYKLSNGTPDRTLQIFFDTALNEGTPPYQVASVSPDGTDISDKWVTRVFTVENPGRPNGGTNNAWDGVLESIRFDFMRYSSNVGATAEIDYIGLFATMEQAEEFMDNPTKNGSADNLAQYDDELAAVNAVESFPAINMADYSEDATMTWGQLNNALNDYIASLKLGVDAYYAITEYNCPVAEVVDNPETEADEAAEAVDGSVTFKIAFADGGIQNGYVVTSKEFTVDIIATTFGEPSEPSEGTEVGGVVYDAIDAEAGTVTVTGATVVDGSAVVPEVVEIEGVEYAVTAIAADAFAGCTAAEVRLPNTITEAVVLTGYEGYVFVQPDTDTAAAVTGDCVKLKGDYNDDKTTEVGDVIKILQTLAGGAVEGYAQLACDVVASEGNLVDVSDVIKLLQWLASPTTVLD